MAHPPKSSTAILDEKETSSTVSVGGNPRFPNTFNVYYIKAGSLNTTIFHLGQNKSQPLYASTFYVGWSGKNNLTLHNGPDTKASTLATVELEHLLRLTSIIKIPSPPAASPITERMRVEYHLPGESHHFSVPSRVGSSVLPERYEWRQSHHGDYWGWKLVRITSNTPYDSAESPNTKKGQVSSDGKEVVATFADNTRLTSLSSKMAKFEFINGGATGELGDIWAIMAVATALRIWQMRWFLGSA